MDINGKVVPEKSVGEIIKHMRKSAGLTQKDLAKLIEKTEAAISMYEKETTGINFINLQNIAKNCDFKILVYDEDSDEFYNII